MLNIHQIDLTFQFASIKNIFRPPLSLKTKGIYIDVARIEHSKFVTMLRELEIDVIELPSDEELPDSVFCEDIAIVNNNIALITHPGDANRQKEVGS